ncbi:MAG: leucine-rich repeat protein [Oscillospiraceae bacterium]|nr:leucine-rich repeat protein [Oscillospiraceae bacterium]
MKKIIALLLALAVVFSFAACGGQSASDTSVPEKPEPSSEQESSAEPETSSTSDNVSGYFVFDDDGTTVTGLTEEGMKQKVLVVPAQAQAFFGFSFDECEAEEVSFEADHDIDIGAVFSADSNLKKVTLPAELSVIPDSAFTLCDGLESIVIPAGVTRIEDWAFDYCENLKEVTFAGTSCEVIGEYAFSNCAFEEIVLPEGVKTVEESAFNFCEQLVSISFPSTIETIAGHVCNGDSLSELHFAAGAENVTIDPFAFMTRTSEITVYIAKDSWMDLNRDSWYVNFGAVEYE